MLVPNSAVKPNINELSSEVLKDYFEAEYQKTSRFQTKFGADTVEIDASQQIARLRREVSRLLVVKGLMPEGVALEDLHHHLSDEMRAYNFNDGVNKISTYFYDTDEGFRDAYRDLIKTVLHDSVFKIPMWFQDTPTIRIHCPNALNSNHYPRYHSDIFYGHPPEEINVWFPLTDVREGHSFRCANVADSAKLLTGVGYDTAKFVKQAVENPSFNTFCDDYAPPVKTELGKVLLFDSRCIHTGEPMKSHTRVSMDVRVIPLEDFEKTKWTFQGAGRRKVLFAPGHCYSNISTDLLNNN